MRNLSYREASVVLVLITAAAFGAYSLWFAPALAQIERDRRTLEELVVVLGKPLRAPSASASVVLGPAAAPDSSGRAPLSPALARPPSSPPRAHGGKPRRDLQASPKCSRSDPLCDDLEM